MGELKPYENYKPSGIAWLGEIPENWEEASLRKLFIDNKIKNESLFENNLLTLSYGRIKNKDINTVNGLLPASFSGYQIVDKGDIVLRLLDLQNDKNSLRVGFVNESGIITSAYIGLKSKRNSCSKYYYHLFHFLDTIKHFYNCGGGVRQSMGFSELGKEKILIPSLQEQTLIANFLDFKLSKIDRFIRMKKALIKLLNEQKAGIINQAVTKGVPRRSFRLRSTTKEETCVTEAKQSVNTAETCDVEAKHSVNAEKTCVVAAKQSVNAANTCLVEVKRSDNAPKTCEAAANWSDTAAKTCDAEPNRSLSGVETSGVETTDVPMKPSGVEWLGDIPEHWEVRKLKYVADFKSGEMITSETITPDGKYPVYGGGGFRGYTDSFTNDGYHILIGRQGALCGNIKYAKNKFWASEHAIVTYLKYKMEIKYLGELLTICNLGNLSQTAAQPGISIGQIRNVRIPVPPFIEQEAIVSHFESETSQINSIISTIEKEISLVQEYRTALIAEAVTGKIDVRDYPIPIGWENEVEEEVEPEMVEMEENEE